MNTSRKAMKWLIWFSIVNLMLVCLLFKKLKKFNESCSLPKAARIEKFIIIKFTSEKVIITDEKLQPTYIHI